MAAAAFAVDLLLGLCALALAIPCAVFVIECLAAVLPGAVEPPLPPLARPLRRAILIPAHDEEAVLAQTLRTVMPQLGPGDRCLVVADNCSDRTAELARAAGATAVERHHPTDRGKGFALAFGMDHLAVDPPDVLIIADADIELSPESVDALTRLAVASDRPVQADYLVVPEAMTPVAVVSALAFLVRNRVRAQGLRRLGLPCHLTGTGMAFTWEVARKAPPTGAYLAEDLLMGLELALRGHPPLYTARARVTSPLPAKAATARSQRTRWEHGQLTTVRQQAPRLLRAGLAKADPRLLALGLDLLVPPLALLVSLLLGGWLATGAAAVLGFSARPVILLSACLVAVATSVLLAWWRFGRATLPGRYLLAIPGYVLWKLPVYASYLLRGRQKTWERTDRSIKDPPAV